MAALVNDLSVYTTKSGRVAFLRSRQETDQGPVFYGYILELAEGRVIHRELAWNESGACLSSSEDGDRLAFKV